MVKGGRDTAYGAAGLKDGGCGDMGMGDVGMEGWRIWEWGMEG